MLLVIVEYELKPNEAEKNQTRNVSCVNFYQVEDGDSQLT